MDNLTIGMATFDDFNGVYFTIQALKMYHGEAVKSAEIIVIDNNPSSKDGQETKAFCEKDKRIKYIESDNSRGAFSKEDVFVHAENENVLVCDCHVLFAPDSILSLKNFFKSGEDKGNLIQGPLLSDSMEIIATHLKPTWGSGMFGQWALDKRVYSEKAFEIPAQGMGVFACKKNSWVGFPKGASGFGGEEYIIHEKFRQAGKGAICLSNLKWLHRFRRPSGAPYSPTRENKFKNHIRGFLEADLPVFEVLEHYKSIGTPESEINKWLEDVTKENG
jgi:glycosyltransferase involved in cell wall biosynthesis